MNEQFETEMMSREIDEFLAKLIEHFGENDVRQRHMGTIIGYSIERFIEMGSRNINDYNKLSKSFREYLKVVHDDIRKRKQQELN